MRGHVPIIRRRFALATASYVLLNIATWTGSATTAPVTRPATAPAGERELFLLDASGSMIERFAAAKAEVTRGIDALADRQPFAIVVVQDSRVVSFAQDWTAASKASRGAAGQFLNHVTTSGPDAFVAAFDMVAAFKPDVVWLVTDGGFAKPRETIEAAKAAHQKARFRIYTSNRYVDDKSEPEAEWLLWTIARESGGVMHGADAQPITDEAAAAFVPLRLGLTIGKRSDIYHEAIEAAARAEREARASHPVDVKKRAVTQRLAHDRLRKMVADRHKLTREQVIEIEREFGAVDP